MYTGMVLMIYAGVGMIVTLAFFKTKLGKNVMNYMLNKLTL